MPFPLRIVHVVSAHGWGGMEARTLETALWQAEHGHEVLVVGQEGGATLMEAGRLGLDGFGLDFDAPDRLSKLMSLRRRLRRHGTTVADFHTNRSFAVGVHDLCAMVRSRHNLRKTAPRRGPPRTFPFDRIIATSEAERIHLIKSGAARGERVNVVGEWADDRFFNPPPRPEATARKRAELGLPARQMVIGACAMMRPDNAFQALIRATARMRARGVPVSCLIVGAEPAGEAVGAERQLRGLADELGVAEAVHFLGHRQDVPELLDVMDVVAVVSRHTAQTRVGPEAAARGKPVVAFDVGAVGEAVVDGQTGLLVELDDYRGFSAALERLLLDRMEREAMGATAACHAHQNFRKSVKMDQTFQAYRQALAARAAPVAAWPQSALGFHPLSIMHDR